MEDLEHSRIWRMSWSHCRSKSRASRWAKPLGKWRERAALIAKAPAGPSINVTNYNFRALTTLSHVAQLSHLPVDAVQMEHSMFASLLNAPFRCMSKADYFNIHKLGCTRLRSVEASSAAAILRTSVDTVRWAEWQDLILGRKLPLTFRQSMTRGSCDVYEVYGKRFAVNLDTLLRFEAKKCVILQKSAKNEVLTTQIVPAYWDNHSFAEQ